MDTLIYIEIKGVYKSFKRIKDTSYFISSDGCIVRDKPSGYKEIINRRLLRGYPGLQVCVEGKLKYWCIHRLLAEAFILNPDNKPCVNHIDGNKLNYALSNLEWATVRENNQHAYDNGLNYSKTKPIAQYDLEGNYIATYQHSRIIEYKLKINRGNLCTHIKKGRGTCGGYVWKFA